MFGIGFGEIVLILFVVLLIYGPDKLPELAQKVGRVVREVRRASAEVHQALTSSNDDPPKDSSRGT